MAPTSDDLSNLKNQLEALKATSSWEELSDTLSKAWDKEEMDQELKEECSEVAAYSAWNLEQWE